MAFCMVWPIIIDMINRMKMEIMASTMVMPASERRGPSSGERVFNLANP